MPLPHHFLCEAREEGLDSNFLLFFPWFLTIPFLWIHHFKKLYVSLGYLAAKSLQSCPTLCNLIDGSPPGSPIPGILQARTLEWVAVSFSNAWKQKKEVAQPCPTLSDPMDCSLPGSSVHGIFQARVLESGATAFSQDRIIKWFNYILKGSFWVENKPNNTKWKMVEQLRRYWNNIFQHWRFRSYG